MTIWPTGSTYEGSYKDSCKYGYGTWTSADKKTSKYGWWINEKFEDKKHYGSAEGVQD